MESPDDCVNIVFACEPLDMSKCADHPRMGASQNDDQPRFGLDVKGLVVKQWIGVLECFIQEKRPSRILKGILTRNLTGHPHTRNHLAWLGLSDDSAPRRAKALAFHEGGADMATLACLCSDELGMGGGGMKKDPCMRGYCEGCFEPARVVSVAVAKNNGIGAGKMDSEVEGVVEKRCSLAGVKQHAVRAGIQPIGEPVLTQDTSAASRVFN